MTTVKPLIERRLAAILAADIAGYSALMGEDEETTVSDLKGHQSVILPMIADFGGRVIDTAGDGILAEYPSALNAVRCAVEIQQTMAERNAGVLQARQMRFRIGVNLGDVVFDENRIYGDGVNIAARLEALAPPGGICVSRSVREAVGNKLSVNFADLGERQVKNIANPVHTYEIRLHDGPEIQQSEPRHPGLPHNPPSAPRILVAILAALALGVVVASIWLNGSQFVALQRSAPPTVADRRDPTDAKQTEQMQPKAPQSAQIGTDRAPRPPEAEPAQPDTSRSAPQTEAERVVLQPDGPRSVPQAETIGAALEPQARQTQPTQPEDPRSSSPGVQPQSTVPQLEARPAAAPTVQTEAEPSPPAVPEQIDMPSPIQPPASGASVGFDGEWIATLTGGAQCPLRHGAHRLTITQGRILESRPDTGRVNGVGAIHYTLPAVANPRITVAFRGKLVGDGGRGTYKASFGACTGVIEFRRSIDEVIARPAAATNLTINPVNRDHGFDGHWQVDLTGGAHCRVKSHRWQMVVRDGQISPSHPEPGHVEPDGNFHFTFPGRYSGLSIRYSGRLSGNAGQGKYSGLGGCSGKIELKRRPQ